MAEIAAILETGSRDGKLPPRPLFGPIGDRVAKNVSRYFLTFLRRHYPDYARLVSGVTSREKKG